MKTIYRYQLELRDKQIIKMLENATVLSVAWHKNSLSIWAMVDLTRRKVDREFFILRTGKVIPLTISERIGVLEHLGTAIAEGSLVYHVFDGGEV